MTSPALPAPNPDSSITTARWAGRPFGPDLVGQIISAIIGGAPFAASVTRLPTTRSAVAFPVLSDIDQPEWGLELSRIPDLAMSDEAYEAAVSRLSGSILLSRESVDDSAFPLTAQVEQIIRDTFSSKLDRDLISGAGPHPVPSGVLSVAGQVAGADLELAAIAAKVEIANSGGLASHIALSASHLGEIESARDGLGHPLYPDAASVFAGLVPVQCDTPTPFVFASDRLWLVVRNDFSVDLSEQTSIAWHHYAVSMRCVGRFAIAAPMPATAIRALTVTSDAGGASAQSAAGSSDSSGTRRAKATA